MAAQLEDQCNTCVFDGKLDVLVGTHDRKRPLWLDRLNKARGRVSLQRIQRVDGLPGCHTSPHMNAWAEGR